MAKTTVKRSAAVRPSTKAPRTKKVNAAPPEAQETTQIPGRSTQGFITLQHSRGFARDIVYAFTSNERQTYGMSGDISPRPHQSFRAGNRMLFSVETDELIRPTLSGWTFHKRDVIEVEPEVHDIYFHGEIIAAIVYQELTILELREDDDDDELLEAYELRSGEVIPKCELFIIGSVRELRRSYHPAYLDTPANRGVDAIIASFREPMMKRKGAR